MTSRQPTWAHPQSSTHEPELKIYNSLTRSKKTFVPIKRQEITWYSCGPTVYDDAHLGHARNYATTDTIRRTLRDYFKFNIKFVMNITDVDDKIILAARKRHLYRQYQQKHRYIDQEVLDDVLRAWRVFLKKKLPRIPREPPVQPEDFSAVVVRIYQDVINGQALDGTSKPGDKEAKVKMYIKDAQNTARALTSDLKNLTPIAFYELAKDAMCDMLDAEQGASIDGSEKNHGIFTELTNEYDQKFWVDMTDLNVLRPDVLVYVTQYGKKIVDFVDKIVEHGFAYETSDGSVYFDIKAFETAGNPYARLEPWNRNNQALQADGEGALSQTTSVKRSEADFALWKASKPGEMYWMRNERRGRPGWHIECSAMASDVLGRQIDIHSGGIDLAFPHHDNELAQSEAYWHSGRSTQWVNYFLHIGHLSIAGSKMSKSLKNFTTIRAALDRGDWTKRSFRIIILFSNWREGMEITDDLIKAGQSWEDRLDNFFLRAQEAVATMEQTHEEPKLTDKLTVAKQRTREALLDSFNFPEVMSTISQLINEYNTTTALTRQDHVDVGLFITRMVNIFGLNEIDSPAEPIEIGWTGLKLSDDVRQYVAPLARMRDQLRQAAIAKSITKEDISRIVSELPAPPKEETHTSTRPARPSLSKVYSAFVQDVMKAGTTAEGPTLCKQILALCDRVRDQDLWNLSIYLEDREGQPALVRPVTAGLRAVRAEKETKERQKAELKASKDKENAVKLAKTRLPPQDMFRPPHSDEYSAWSDEGLPTKMKDGSDVTASKLKKLKKDYERQAAAYGRYVKSVQEGQHTESAGDRSGTTNGASNGASSGTGNTPTST